MVSDTAEARTPLVGEKKAVKWTKKRAMSIIWDAIIWSAGSKAL